MKSSNRHRFVRSGLGSLGAWALTTHAALAAWEVVPDIELAVEARDNARLQDSALVTEGDDASTRMLFNGRFSMANVGRRGDFFVEPRIRSDTYADSADDELESDDVFLDARGRYQWEKTTAGFRTYLARESILHSEIVDAEPIDPDIDDPVAVDTGRLIQLDQTRSQTNIAPYANVEMSERSSVLLEARHLDVSFSGPEVPGRSDFQDTLVSAGIVRQVNDRNRATAKLIVSNFEADANENTTDTIGVEGTFSRILSDIWTFTISTGLQRSDITFTLLPTPLLPTQVVDDVDTNVTLGLGFRKRSDLATLNLDLRRLVDPNSSGFLEQRDELRLSLRRRMSPTLTGGVAFRIIDAGTLTDVLPTTGRDYARLGLSLEWALSRTWSLGVGYDSIYQKFANQDRDENSNAVSVGVTYRGISRRDN